MSQLPWDNLPEVPLDQETYWLEAFGKHRDNVYVGSHLYRILKQRGRDQVAEELCGAFEITTGRLYKQYLFDQERFQIIEAPNERPDEPDGFLVRGEHYQTLGEEQKALTDYTRAIELRPASGQIRAIRGALRATAHSDDIRDGLAAREDAQLAMRLAAAEGLLRGDWIHWRFLDVLAAAFAELGEFATASGLLQLPLRQVLTKRIRRHYQERIAQYEAGQPLRLKSNIMPTELLTPASAIPDGWFPDAS